MLWALLVAGGYLAGSVPFGVVITRMLGRADPRESGSGNIGATNVARVAGKKLGVLVLLLDASKGAVPVLVAIRLLPESPWIHAGVGLAAFLGHVFPVWLRFHGGKGVATALGVFGVLLPLAAVFGFVVYAAIFLTTRVASLASLAGSVVAVGSSFFIGRPREYSALAGVLLLLILFTHRGNIGRILKRKELKL
ncbi:MAG: glycerol-3-phosphate 1-O-acyltransferase PlsY [Myxococcaceae bacterium]